MNQQDIRNKLDILKRMGPPPPSLLYREDDGKGSKRCLCGEKFIAVQDLKVFTTMDQKVLDLTCKDCRANMQDSSRIVCMGCREVIINMDPHKKKNGFSFVKNGVYHVTRCPRCDSVFKDYIAQVNELLPSLSDREAEDLAKNIEIKTVEEILFERQL